MGVLTNIVVVDEFLLSTQKHQRKRTTKVNFQKTTFTMHQQTIELKNPKQIAALK